MKRQQLVLLISGIVLVALLYFFGQTSTPKKDTAAGSVPAQANANTDIQFSDILAKSYIGPESASGRIGECCDQR